MALTNAEIIQIMRALEINADLTDAQITEAIDAWIRIIILRCPMETLGTFQTVAGQQEYDLFGVGGAFAGGRSVLELYGPSGCGSDLDVFGMAPWMQNMNISSLTGGMTLSLDYPGDFINNDRIWAHFRERFRMVRFIRKEGRNGSPILLDPVPGDAHTVMARYTRPRTDAEAREDDAILLAGVEWRSLELLARRYVLTAGVRIGDHEDKGLTAKYYWDAAKARRDEALSGLDGLNSCGAWTISAATRS